MITFASQSWKNPNWGDTFTIEMGVLYSRNHGDDLYVLALPERPLNNQINVKLSNLSNTDVDNLLNAIIASQALLVTMTDHEGRDWTGFFSGEPTVTRGRNACQHSVEFSFEGDIDGQVSGIDN
jgi:hypothetical protein